MCSAGISLSESVVDQNSQLGVMTFTRGVKLQHITGRILSVTYLPWNLCNNELTDAMNDLIFPPSPWLSMDVSQSLAHLYTNRFCIRFFRSCVGTCQTSDFLSTILQFSHVMIQGQSAIDGFICCTPDVRCQVCFPNITNLLYLMTLNEF